MWNSSHLVLVLGGFDDRLESGATDGIECAVGDLAVAVGLNGDKRRADQIDVIAVPEIGLDDAPVTVEAGWGARGVPGDKPLTPVRHKVNAGSGLTALGEGAMAYSIARLL